MKITVSHTVVLVIMLLWLPAIAHANVGIPTLYLTVPAMSIALIVVVPLEAAILRRYLKLGIGQSMGVSALMNITSTLFGFPVAAFSEGLSAALLSFSSIKSGFLYDLRIALMYGLAFADFGGKTPSGWVFPAGIFLMLVYYLLLSWLIEWGVIRVVHLDSLREKKGYISKAVILANVSSYILLSIALVLLISIK